MEVIYMIVENLICSINILFLPLISLYIYFERQNKQLQFSLYALCVYAVFAVFNSMVCKAILSGVRFVFDKDISPTSSYYTAFGVLVCVALAFLLEILKNHFSISIKKRDNDEE